MRTLAVPLLALGYGAYLVRAYATGALYVYIHPIYVVPASPLGVATAVQRGLDLAPAATSEVRTVTGPPETFTIKDWVAAFQSDPEPSRHAGKPARVTGFVMRDRRLPQGWFLVARFAVQCCAVDAQPLGLVVKPAGGDAPAEGAWVAVDGVVDVAEVEGERLPIVAARAVAPTEPPAQPYLY